MLTAMTTFWTRFMQLPDSIRVTAWWAHQREVDFPYIQGRRSTLLMVDMPAMAAQYPSVAAALKAAGLTAQQHEASLLAIASAYAWWDHSNRPVIPSVMKNAVFLQAHPDELQALYKTGVFDTYGRHGLSPKPS